jgi:hypothetical protein
MAHKLAHFVALVNNQDYHVLRALTPRDATEWLTFRQDARASLLALEQCQSDLRAQIVRLECMPVPSTEMAKLRRILGMLERI